MTQPVVSIIMASYNSAQHITAAIYSVLMQTVNDIELVVVDDASTDTSPEIVEKISRIDQRVRLFRAATNGGPAAARNLALEKVRGRWVAIMDSDDLMIRDRLERMITLAEADKADIVADNPLLFWDDRSTAPALHLDLSKPATLNPIDFVNSANKCGYLKVVFRSARLGHIRYDERLIVGEDFDYYLRGLMTTGNFRIFPMTGYLYRIHNRPASNARTRRNVEAMLASNIRFRAEFAKSGSLSVACKNREDELRSTLNYLNFVDLFKEKRILAAIGYALNNPSCFRRFDQPMKAALTRLRTRLMINPTAPVGASDWQALVDRLSQDLNDFGEQFCPETRSP